MSTDSAPENGPVRDAVILAQYRRRTHCGITGFGTAMAFPQAVKLDEDVKELEAEAKKMYDNGELMTELAEAVVNVSAASNAS